MEKHTADKPQWLLGSETYLGRLNLSFMDIWYSPLYILALMLHVQPTCEPNTNTVSATSKRTSPAFKAVLCHFSNQSKAYH